MIHKRTDELRIGDRFSYNEDNFFRMKIFLTKSQPYSGSKFPDIKYVDFWIFDSSKQKVLSVSGIQLGVIWEIFE